MLHSYVKRLMKSFGCLNTCLHFSFPLEKTFSMMFCTSVTPFLITFELTGQFQMDLTERTENSKIITLLQSS